MPAPDALYHWTARVQTHFPHLTPARAALLALASFGLVLARTCGLTAVAGHLARLLGRHPNALRQRLRELYQPAGVQSGRNRSQFDAALCFGPLARWAAGGRRRLVLALDPTNLGDRFTVLCASAVGLGCAIPVAWDVRRADQKGGWNEAWKALLGRLRAALGDGWEVLVLTDRGLESRELFAAICALGWHPLMRAKAANTFRPAGWRKPWAMGRFAAAAGRRWAGAGVAYQGESRLPCTLLACWGEGHEGPWLLLTDLPPAAAEPCWYGWRAWIEQGFKVLKGGGWQWQQTRMRDPERVARYWAALALATLWALEVGGEAQRLESQGKPLPKARPERAFRVGLAVILAALINGQALPEGRFAPLDWPEPQATADQLTEEQMDQG
jgi:hypothetical protein